MVMTLAPEAHSTSIRDVQGFQIGVYVLAVNATVVAKSGVDGLITYTVLPGAAATNIRLVSGQ